MNGARPLVPSDDVCEEALAILDRGDIEPVAGAPGMVIVGSSQGIGYVVHARTDAVVCECLGFARRAICGHSVAAMIRWELFSSARGRLLGRLLQEEHEQELEREREIAEAMGA